MRSPRYHVGDRLRPVAAPGVDFPVLCVSQVTWDGERYLILLRASDGVDFGRFSEAEVAQCTVRVGG